ncbi:MAG TPA: Ig-like domain-containing protein [Vicinamibacterales bacterium]|nr:Ig-like domain-containing protein [Vicinamibacterales bacterium]
MAHATERRIPRSAVGDHLITATYGGDGNLAGSTSAPLTQIVYDALEIVRVSGGGFNVPEAPYRAVFSVDVRAASSD